MEKGIRTGKAATSATTVTKFKKFAVTMLAAATVAFGGLAAQPTASAMPMTCSAAMNLASIYIATGKVFLALGDYVDAVYWFGRAEGLTDAAC